MRGRCDPTYWAMHPTTGRRRPTTGRRPQHPKGPLKQRGPRTESGTEWERHSSIGRRRPPVPETFRRLARAGRSAGGSAGLRARRRTRLRTRRGAGLRARGGLLAGIALRLARVVATRRTGNRHKTERGDGHEREKTTHRCLLVVGPSRDADPGVPTLLNSHSTKSAELAHVSTGSREDRGGATRFGRAKANKDLRPARPAHEGRVLAPGPPVSQLSHGRAPLPRPGPCVPTPPSPACRRRRPRGETTRTPWSWRRSRTARRGTSRGGRS